MVRATPLSIYLPTTINNVQVNFIVDTGAQSTSITEEVAQATSISRVLNDSVKTEVSGVGKGMTVGFEELRKIYFIEKRGFHFYW